jgi:Glycosyl hydrolases family 16
MWSSNSQTGARRLAPRPVRQGLGLSLAFIGLLLLKPAGAAEARTDCPEAADALSTREIFSDFTRGGLDSCDWIKVQSNWGGHTESGDYSGGVIKANVGERDGMLVLTAHGNRYDGDIRGYDRDGSMRPDGRRTGAAIMSRQRYLGGRFEARVTIPAVLGVASALWTFFYAETPGGAEENHEIDIEFPGRPSDDGAPSLGYVMFSTWRGLAKGQWTTAFEALPGTVTDGKFHDLRFDWHPPDVGSQGSVAFYIDGRLLETIRTNVPSKPGNVWLGLWFPPKWAGVPDFSTAEMKVDWIRISPLD